MQPKTQTEEESNGWEGQVTSIKNVVQHSSKTMRNETKRDISSVQNEVASTQKAVKQLEERCNDLNNISQKQLQQNELQMNMMRDIQRRIEAIGGKQEQ